MRNETFRHRRLSLKACMLLACMLVALPYFSSHIPHSSSLLAQTQTGKASYYAKKFEGRRTASGERLSGDSLTCAHRTYPFGTKLRVTNLSNGKVVIVRVTDRGPFARGRIIDLSRRAAREIGMMAQGVVNVRVDVVDPFIVPFRPSMPETLPEYDFEIAPEIEYGVTEDWYDITISPADTTQAISGKK